MSVWLTVPSKRPPAEVEKWAQAWRAQGYLVALWLDDIDSPLVKSKTIDYFLVGRYPGYAEATNSLMKEVMTKDPFANWLLVGGDDVYPEQNKRADEIAAECEGFFARCNGGFAPTLGIMQPTGDEFGADPNHRDPAMRGSYISRTAGSAWIGREAAQRMYSGNGPLWHEYRHMFVDAELRDVGVKLGIYWERPDLTQIHQHWGRPLPGETMGQADRMPDFLAEANSPEHWRKFKALYEARRSAGFPGSGLSA